MLKSLLMASALTMAFSGTAMADNSPASAAGCTSCSAAISNAGAPVKMAQVDRNLINQGVEQAPARGIGIPQNGDIPPLQTCCDPALEKISWGSFTYDEDLTNPNYANRYGVKYLPSAAFHNAMHQTRMLVHVALLSPQFTFIVMDGDMRTDNTPADSPSLSNVAGPNDASNHYWAPSGAFGASHAFQAAHGNGPSISNRWMAAWWGTTPAPAAQWPAINTHSPTFDLAHVSTWPAANTHMRSDNTAYVLRPTFTVYYRYAGGPYLKRTLLCNNLKDRYAPFQRVGTSGFKMAPGATQLGFIAGDTPQAKANMRLGAPTAVTADEVKKLEELQRTNNM